MPLVSNPHRGSPAAPQKAESGRNSPDSVRSTLDFFAFTSQKWFSLCPPFRGQEIFRYAKKKPSKRPSVGFSLQRLMPIYVALQASNPKPHPAYKRWPLCRCISHNLVLILQSSQRPKSQVPMLIFEMPEIMCRVFQGIFSFSCFVPKRSAAIWRRRFHWFYCMDARSLCMAAP